MKEFLSQNKIEFIERNIAADEWPITELEKLGYMTSMGVRERFSASG
ncbi:MAG: hypothetical protein HY234_12755 [Acidobacteria bacterium]|nr:hypothetical protein [Acidobacteriota bacterium]